MSTELVSFNPSELVNLQKFSNEDFEKVSGTGDFTPRIQLMSSSTDLCKKGLFPVNHYALIKSQNHIDLGKEVNVVVLAYRPKALRILDSAVEVSYDPISQEFKEIQDASNETDSGCMYGPEFFVWLPVKDTFATLFMGSKSARREAPNIRALMPGAATLKSKLIEYKKYTWQAVMVTTCSTPLLTPPMSVIVQEVEKFNNPPKFVLEEAPQDSRDR